MKILILAGGSGMRLWPFSRKAFPKQFLHFGDGASLLQKTLKRYLLLSSPQNIFILTNQNYYHLVKRQVTEIDPSLAGQILVEPEKKNTAPALSLAVSYLKDIVKVDPEETLLVSSSDHLITSDAAFLEGIKKAAPVAAQGYHILFGIRPTRPETGYGYIQVASCKEGELVPAKAFVEKPEYATAETYLLSGEYLWNTGIFLFHLPTLEAELRLFNPEIDHLWKESFKETSQGFGDMPDISIDYALMEKSAKILVMPLAIGWSDIGSWDSVYDSLEKDDHQNVKIGNVHDFDTENCLILGSKRLISTVGLRDLFIIETEDALLIGKKGLSQQVKALVASIHQRGHKESHEHITTHRPWGTFSILGEGERYKIKKILVYPGQRLSLQMHHHRSEHWVVVQGKARVTIGHQTQDVHENESVYITKSQYHRLENPGKIILEMIEVQVGEYVGEDDIVRFEDDYARV